MCFEGIFPIYSNETEAQMSEESNKDLACRYLEEVYARGNLGLIDELRHR